MRALPGAFKSDGLFARSRESWAEAHWRGYQPHVECEFEHVSDALYEIPDPNRTPLLGHLIS